MSSAENPEVQDLWNLSLSTLSLSFWSLSLEHFDTLICNLSRHSNSIIGNIGTSRSQKVRFLLLSSCFCTLFSFSHCYLKSLFLSQSHRTHIISFLFILRDSLTGHNIKEVKPRKSFIYVYIYIYIVFTTYLMKCTCVCVDDSLYV